MIYKIIHKIFNSNYNSKNNFNLLKKRLMNWIGNNQKRKLKLFQIKARKKLFKKNLKKLA